MSKQEQLLIIERIDQIPDDLLVEMEEWWIKKLDTIQIVAKLKERGFRIKKPSCLRNWCRQLFPDSLLDSNMEQAADWVMLPDELQALRLLWHKTKLWVREIDISSSGAPKRLTTAANIALRLAGAQKALLTIELESKKAGKKHRQILEEAKEALLLEFRKAVPDHPEMLEELTRIYNDLVNRYANPDDDDETRIMN